MIGCRPHDVAREVRSRVPDEMRTSERGFRTKWVDSDEVNTSATGTSVGTDSAAKVGSGSTASSGGICSGDAEGGLARMMEGIQPEMEGIEGTEGTHPEMSGIQTEIRGEEENVR